MPQGYFFSTSEGKCAPGKKSLRFHYIGIQAKYSVALFSDGDLLPVVQNTQELLHHRLPHAYILCLQTQIHPSLIKNVQYYCPSGSSGKKMRAFTNLNDNQRLNTANIHKQEFTRSSTVPRTCNYRCLKRCL